MLRHCSIQKTANVIGCRAGSQCPETRTKQAMTCRRTALSDGVAGRTALRAVAFLEFPSAAAMAGVVAPDFAQRVARRRPHFMGVFVPALRAVDMLRRFGLVVAGHGRTPLWWSNSSYFTAIGPTSDIPLAERHCDGQSGRHLGLWGGLSAFEY